MRYGQMWATACVLGMFAATISGQVNTVPPTASTQPTTTLPTPTGKFFPLEEVPPEVREKMRQLEKMGGVFHGVQCGEPLPDGWVKITSTSAGFSVAMPGPAVDFHLTAKTTDGVEFTSATVGSGDRTVKYLATCMRRADGKTKDSLAKFIADTRIQPDFRGGKDITKDSHRGYEAHMESARSSATIRHYEADGAAYLCIVECPPQLAKEMAPKIERFMESLRFPAKR